MFVCLCLYLFKCVYLYTYSIYTGDNYSKILTRLFLDGENVNSLFLPQFSEVSAVSIIDLYYFFFVIYIYLFGCARS